MLVGSSLLRRCNTTVPLPDPNMALNLPPFQRARKVLFRFVFSGLLFCVLNLFGLFSSALDSLCETGTCGVRISPSQSPRATKSVNPTDGPTRCCPTA